MNMDGRINVSIFTALILTILASANAFVLPQPADRHSLVLEPLFSDRFNRDLEERSRRRAANVGVGGETIAGAVLGTLVAGPFGLFFGSQIGASIGAKNALNRARKEEMERLGITQEMLDSAEQVGIALNQAAEALKATETSLETQKSLARRLERDSEEMYENAKAAMVSGKEEEARKFLYQKTECQERLKKVLQSCVDEKQRYDKMRENVVAIETRALEIEALLRRSVSASALQQQQLQQQSIEFKEFSSSSISSSSSSSLPEDPLLQKFRDMGID